ncbi:hypothetical protein Tco_0294700 [Tanacetum coccineum]
MAALQADLQTTKGLIQAERYGDGGETAPPIQGSMRLDVPNARNRFGPCKYEDPQGALSNLLQKGMVAQCQGEFENLMNHATDVSDGLLISFYVSVLKPAIQLELLVSKPTSLGDAFALARVTEARLDDQRVSIVSQATTDSSGGGSQRTQLLRILAAVSQPAAFEEEDTDAVTEAIQKDALEGGDISILNSLVGYDSPWSLQLWGILGAKKLLERVGKMAYVLALPDSSKIHPSSRLFTYLTTLRTRQPIEDESWFLAHEIDYPNVNEKTDHGKNKSTQENRVLKGRDVFDDKSSEVFSVTPWAAKGGRRVLCYVQGSGRRKRKKSVGCSNGRRDYSLFGASIFPLLSSGPVLFLIKEYRIPKSR